MEKNDAPVALICVYTSGILPLADHPWLKRHDDWGIKYLGEKLPTSYPFQRLSPVCESLCQEAQDFLQGDETALFCRAWEEGEEKFLSLAAFDRENTTFRRNILVALFYLNDDSIPLLEVISRLHIAGEPLPQGLKKLKRDAQSGLQLSSREHKTLTNFLAKEGPPRELSPIRVGKTIKTSPPKFGYLYPRMPKLGVATLLVLLCAIAWMLNPEDESDDDVSLHGALTPKATTAPPVPDRSRFELEALRRENIELQQKLDLVSNELYRTRRDLERKDDIAGGIGGWKALEDIVRKLRSLSIPIEQLEREIKEAKRDKKRLSHVKNTLRSLLHYLKKAQIGKGEARNRSGELVETSILSAFELQNVERQLEEIVRKP